jgi:hypothetical protein
VRDTGDSAQAIPDIAGVIVIPLPTDLVDAPPPTVARWFDNAMAGFLAEAASRHAKADNTRRAFRAVVRGWLCLLRRARPLAPPRPPGRHRQIPGRPASARVAAPAARRQHAAAAAIACLHHAAGLPCPTTAVTETFAGLDRLAKRAGLGPKPKAAAKIDILRGVTAGALFRRI